MARCIPRVELEAEARLLAKASKVDLANFDNSNWHDRLARAKKDVAWRPGDLTWSLFGLSSNIVTILLMASLLASLHFILVILAIGAAAVSTALESRIATKLYEFSYRETPQERERRYVGELLSQSRMTKEIRANVLADYLLKRHGDLSNELFKQREQVYKKSTQISVLTGLVTGTTLALAYLFVSIQGREKFDQGIVFENVGFKYFGAAKNTIEGFNLNIKSGELLAIVGENGAGKSTVIKLLLRFYEATEGSIKVGGVCISKVDPTELRRRIGVLFQDYANYEFSIKENISMGRPEAEVSEDRILLALREARGERILKKLPNGLNSMVGRLFKGGQDLSGGEWQRLALARLIYRDADIWILDEPTSAMDPDAEAAIFAQLKKNLNGRICIVISHRFSTVRIADRIAVISDGSVSEIGSHEELLKAKGRYYQLFELQANGYR